MGFHNRRLHGFIVYWELPNMTIMKLFDDCFFGNETEKVPPFYLLQQGKLSYIRPSKYKNYGKVILRMMRSMMK